MVRMCFPTSMHERTSLTRCCAEFIKLSNTIMRLHDKFMVRFQSSAKAGDNIIKNCDLEGSANNHNIEGNGNPLQLSQQTSVSFSYISLLLCNLPGLMLNYAPQVNQRSVEPSQFFADGETGISMATALESGQDTGIDAKRILVYPFRLVFPVASVSPLEYGSPLRSVCKTNYNFGNHNVNSTIIELSNAVAIKSSIDDYSRLLFLLGINNYAESSKRCGWDQVFTTNKLSTDEELDEFFYNTGLPDTLKVYSNSGEGEFPSIWFTRSFFSYSF